MRRSGGVSVHTGMFRACSSGNMSAMRHWLRIFKSFDVVQPLTKRTPLMLVALASRDDMFDLVLGNTSETYRNLCDCDGGNVLFYACGADKFKRVEALVALRVPIIQAGQGTAVELSRDQRIIDLIGAESQRVIDVNGSILKDAVERHGIGAKCAADVKRRTGLGVQATALSDLGPRSGALRAKVLRHTKITPEDRALPDGVRTIRAIATTGERVGEPLDTHQISADIMGASATRAELKTAFDAAAPYSARAAADVVRDRLGITLPAHEVKALLSDIGVTTTVQFMNRPAVRRAIARHFCANPTTDVDAAAAYIRATYGRDVDRALLGPVLEWCARKQARRAASAVAKPVDSADSTPEVD